MNEKVILNTSDEAAKFVTGISGWVACDGTFWGENEQAARYRGCTHIVCDCGRPVKKGWLKCEECRDKEANERFSKMPNQIWNEETPITLYDGDEYFFDRDELEDYCEEYETTPEELRLLLCRPVYASEINPNEYYRDNLPEDGEVDGELAEKFDELNKFIREHKTVLSWTPTNIAAIVKVPHA